MLVKLSRRLGDPRLLLIIFVFLSYSRLSPASTIIARVNGEPIYEEDLLSEPNLSKEELLNKTILFRLALQEAKAQGLDRSPEFRQETNRLLYRSFLDKQLEDDKSITPSISELEAYYLEHPLLRLRHLYLDAKTPEAKNQAKEKVSLIQKKLRDGKEFKDLVVKYSQDDNAKMQGDLDFHGPDSLPDAFVQAAKGMKKGNVSEPIEMSDAFHFVQLIDRKSFAEAPATYKEFLKGEIKTERSRTLLASVLAKLKHKAKVEIGPERFKPAHNPFDRPRMENGKNRDTNVAEKTRPKFGRKITEQETKE